MRRVELLLLTLFGGGAVIAALLARAATPYGEWEDPRHSTYLRGPEGIRGAADALAALGLPVERLRVPLFQIVADTTAARRGDLIALLDPPFQPTPVEQDGLVQFVRHGGLLLLVGSAVLRRFGLEAAPIPRTGPRGIGPAGDTASLRPPAAIGELPVVRHTLTHAEWDTAAWRAGGLPVPLRPTRYDTLLLTTGGQPVAMRLVFGERAAGSVLALADPALITNAALKRTDAGALVLPWILALGSRRVVVDEYHQAFGRDWAVAGVMRQWLVSTPAGWAMLQLTFAALVALAAAAVRFGPAVSVISRRRRSPLEHVEALGRGLERAGGEDAAVELIVQGLRRRLASGDQPVRARGDQVRWLASLAGSLDQPAARRAASRLSWLLREHDGGRRVLDAARIAEDVWQALSRTRRSAS